MRDPGPVMPGRRPTVWRSATPASRSLSDVTFALSAGADRGRARTQRRRQDDALSGAARRARAARGDGRRATALRRRPADRALAAGLPGQRARRRADGRDLARCRGGAGPAAPSAAAARAALDAVGLADRADAHLRRALRRPAPARARRARARAGRAAWCCSTSRSAGSTRRAPSASRRCSPSSPPTAARCSSRRTTSSRSRRWDRVLCLNGRQIAFGAPAEVAHARRARGDLRRRDRRRCPAGAGRGVLPAHHHHHH